MIRFGIAGFGHHAVKRLMPGFAKAQRCRVTALSRRDPQRAQDSARQFGIPHAFTSTAELCACPEVDAVFVASPDALHLADVLEAIRHRKPVLVEKPMAMNSAEAATMVEAARSRGRVAGSGAQHALRAQRAVVPRPSDGRMRLASRCWREPPLLRLCSAARAPGCKIRSSRPADRWLTSASTASIRLRYVLDDEVESVTMQAQYDSHSVLEASASGRAALFPRNSGERCCLRTRRVPDARSEIVGENGVLSAVNALNVEHPVTLELRRGFEIVERTEVMQRRLPTPCSSTPSPRPSKMEREFLISGEDGLRNQLVLDAAFRSIKSGKTEPVAAASGLRSSALR